MSGQGVSVPRQQPADVPGRPRDWVINTAQASRLPPLRLGQFWQQRELIYFFALRDLKVRYKQAFLGVAWAGIQPLIGALTFTILFNRLAHVDIDGRSYFAFAMVGFGAWTYYSSTLQVGTTSLLYNAELLTKVSFPRIVAPTATFLPGLIDLGVALVLATVASIASGNRGSFLDAAICLPAGVVLLIVAVAGPVFFLSAVLVKYRDASTLVAFGLQLFLFASPVGYPPELISSTWRTLLYLNPLAGALGLLRTGLVGTDLPTAPQLLLSAVVATVVFFAGIVHFRRSEREFADII